MTRSKRTTTMLAAGAAIGAGLLIARSLRNRFSFDGKSVVITGGSRGLGLELARRLVSEGAHVTLLARTADDLNRAAAELSDRYHADVLAIPCDVTQQHEVESAIALAVEYFGRIDVLINNAGIIQIGPIDNMGMHDFEQAMDVHFRAPLFTMMEVIPHMRANGGGRIVNISSIGGKVAVPHLTPYCASKYALVGLSDSMRAELARDNIKVTTVCPWFMRTGSVYNVQVKGNHEREFAWFAWGGSIPVLTLNAQRAARRIIEACRRGSPRLVMSVFGKSAALANELAPGLMATIQSVANRILPKADLVDGDFPRTGWQSRSMLTPDSLLWHTRRVASRNNQLLHAGREIAVSKPTDEEPLEIFSEQS